MRAAIEGGCAAQRRPTDAHRIDRVRAPRVKPTRGDAKAETRRLMLTTAGCAQAPGAVPYAKISTPAAPKLEARRSEPEAGDLRLLA